MLQLGACITHRAPALALALASEAWSAEPSQRLLGGAPLCLAYSTAGGYTLRQRHKAEPTGSEPYTPKTR